MVKPRSQQTGQKHNKIGKKVGEVLAEKIPDKSYGKSIQQTQKDVSLQKEETLERVTITLPQDIRYLLDDIAMERKRNKQPNKTVSAIVREALDDYLKRTGRR